MIDHYILGVCNRISPEAPVPVVEFQNEHFLLGGAANVLRSLNSLGARADLMGIIGDDLNGRIIIGELKEQGCGYNGVIKDPNRVTTIKTRILAVNHQLLRVDREVTEPVTEIIADQLIDFLKQNVSQYDLVLISDYNKGLLSKYLLEQIFVICKEAGKTTILDPKGLDFTKYQGIDIIKPNKKEASIATGILITDLTTLKAACLKIKQQTGCKDVIVTMSEEGIACYTNETLSIIPTKALGVIDVTGAGDTVLAALALMIAAGEDIYAACDFANHAAAVVVSKSGTATVTLQEIEEKFKK